MIDTGKTNQMTIRYKCSECVNILLVLSHFPNSSLIIQMLFEITIGLAHEIIKMNVVRVEIGLKKQVSCHWVHKSVNSSNQNPTNQKSLPSTSLSVFKCL